MCYRIARSVSLMDCTFPDLLVPAQPTHIEKTAALTYSKVSSAAATLAGLLGSSAAEK